MRVEMPSAPDTAELRKREEALWQSETRNDPAWMDQTLAADFVEFGQSGRRYERAEIIATPSADLVATLPLPDYAVALIAPDVALATYVSAEQRGAEQHLSRRASLWVKTGGRWVLRFHQGTPC